MVDSCATAHATTHATSLYTRPTPLHALRQSNHTILPLFVSSSLLLFFFFPSPSPPCQTRARRTPYVPHLATRRAPTAAKVRSSTTRHASPRGGGGGEERGGEERRGEKKGGEERKGEERRGEKRGGEGRRGEEPLTYVSTRIRTALHSLHKPVIT